MRLPILLALLLSYLPLAQGMTVTFISPGRPDERYWVDVSEVMRQAARDLDIHLSVRYAGRDLLREVELVREVAALPPGERPDYLLLANEKRVLPQQLALAEAAGIPALLAFNAPDPADRAALGVPRAPYRLWLGTLTPQAERAGYLTAKGLIEAGYRAGLADADGRLRLLALAGDRSSDASQRRNAGLAQALAEFPGVSLEQTVYAEWSRAKAQGQMTHLLRRHPEARLVWTGNDQMAFGAMQAALAAGREPGRDMLFSTINSSAEALAAMAEGRLAALAGGHYVQGAFALVLLHDYHHGLDFAATDGVSLDRPLFVAIDRAQAARLLARGPVAVDFRRFSKVHGAVDYRFAIEPLMEPAR